MGHGVLVVEDDTDIRESLIEILEESGFPTVGVANGHEALERLRGSRQAPCLILLDLMMPVMDGISFRREQLKTPELAGIPVVVLSAYRDIEERAKDMNVVAYVKKPLDLDDLIGVARRYCGGPGCASAP
jgi:CheY-like chemotaxis protein